MFCNFQTTASLFSPPPIEKKFLKISYISYTNTPNFL